MIAPSAADPAANRTIGGTDTAPAVADSTEPARLVETKGKGTGLWIVELAEPSLATYPGGIAGLAPTSPQITGADQLDVDAPASRAYLDHITDRHADLRADINAVLGRSVRVEHEYRNVINGLAVRVDQAEAKQLTKLPGVAAVYRDVERELLTDVSHDLIGSPSIWTGETADDAGTRGEGVLVGVIDSGINPHHPSFAATDGEGYTHTNPFGPGTYAGVCEPGHPRHEDICNDKLVGAWNFHPDAPNAQDADGHGSHTASTVAGNVHDAAVTIDGDTFTRKVQGVAPRANIISYLVCHPSCPGTSSVAAVDQAIEDGVDVLNYSISGSDSPWDDFVDQAFLEAFNAGIFVAASAGNSGPGAGTVAHTGPWNAAVAATTHSRAFVNTLTVTGPAPAPDDVVGLPAAPGTGPAVDAGIDAQIRDAAAIDSGNAQGCRAFPASAFAGALALIDRGTCDFADKVIHAADAGAAAVVVVNSTAEPPTAMGGLEDTTIPAVMIEQDAGAALRAFLAGHDDVTGRLDSTTQMVTDQSWEDMVAGFSSRGPSSLDVLAPTFAAPGVNILAAGAARDGDPNQYLVNSGTSMASPHAAGAGALLTALHPDWSPAEIRSALASSADTDIVAEDGTTPADPLDVGSGRLDLDGAGRIGLVMDETYSDFVAADPADGGNPRSLNLPSLVDSSCVESCSWTRTVRNAAAVEATYTAGVATPEGVSVTVEPPEFTVAPGATQDVRVTADVDLSTLDAGQPVFAEVEFGTDATHANGRPVAPVHYPVVVTPRQVVPPTLTVDPGSVTSSQRVDQVVERTLTLGNTGNRDLLWEVYADDTLRRPRGSSTEVESVEPSGARPATSGQGGSLAPAAGANDDAPAVAVIPEPTAGEQDDVAQTITHSASQALLAGNGIACTPDDGVTTTGNSYLRTFTLTDFGIDSEFDVTKVEFGVENLTAEQELTVTLYTMPDPEAPLTYDNLEAIGSSVQTLRPQSLTLAAVPVTGLVEAGSTLVVEVTAPDMSGTGGFWPGTNRAGQTAPSYIHTPACEISGPTDLAALGFPYAHLVMNVTGTTDAPQCDAPDDLPWLGVAPLSGSVAPNGSEKLELTLDSTGVAPGRPAGTLCLRTNDPDQTITTVPLAMTVVGDGAVGDAFHTGLDLDGLPDDQAGNAVAIDGDTAVVGAFLADVGEFANVGAAHVYTRNGDGWQHQATLLPPEDEHTWGLLFGSAVAVDGDTIVVGAPGASFGDSKPGAAYVFVRDGDSWTQQAKLGTDQVRWGAEFGKAVALAGDTVAVGVPGEHVGDNTIQGAAFTFVRDGDAWSQGQRLVASDGSAFSNFGAAVGMDTHTMVIGAPHATVGGEFRQGAAYVFTRDGDGWTEQAILTPSDPAPELSFGMAVDVDRGTAVVGASGPGLDWVDSHGAGYVYTGRGEDWAEQAKLTPADAHVNNRFGWSVGVDRDTVVVGAPYQGPDAGVNLEKGAAVVFTREHGGWIEQRTLIASDTAQGDRLGTAVAVSGDDVVAGAPNADVGDNADQGSAYVFVPGKEALAPPAITITPDELAAEMNPGGTAGEQLTISNGGAQDLRWAIDTESTVSGPLRPAGAATAVETEPAPVPESESANGAAADGWAVSPGEKPSRSTQRNTQDTAPEPAADVVRLTHSVSMDVAESSVPVCANNQTGTTRENRFLRTFTLKDFGIEGAFDVAEVTFGLQLVAPAADLTVNLYTLDGAFEYLDLTRLASQTVSVENVQETLVSVPVSARVPAGSTLVMEVVAPDMEGVGFIVPGANSAGQTAPSYVSAKDCGAPNPVTMESLGFPDAHLVMAVDGTPLEPISCELPAWLAVDPGSGTVESGSESVADVTFDAAGLAVGHYSAHLCVTSNDPTAPVTTVPVSLTVAEPAGDPVLTVETFMERGIWYAELSWTGAASELVGIERDGRTVATVDNTGSYTDMIGRPKRGDSFTYRVCDTGTGTCSEPVTVYPRGKIRGPRG